MKHLTASQTITIRNQVTGNLETYNVHTGELVNTNGLPAAGDAVLYTAQLGDAIANLVRDGLSLAKVAAIEGMPSPTWIHKWRRMHPDFNEKLVHAREDRAFQMREQAEELLEKCAERDDVPVAKFKFDSYMKLAEKDNPKDFGTQTKITGDANAPLQIIVNTGIIRSNHEETAYTKGQQASGDFSARTEIIDGDYTVREPTTIGEAEDKEQVSGEEDQDSEGVESW